MVTIDVEIEINALLPSVNELMLAFGVNRPLEWRGKLNDMLRFTFCWGVIFWYYQYLISLNFLNFSKLNFTEEKWPEIRNRTRRDFKCKYLMQLLIGFRVERTNRLTVTRRFPISGFRVDPRRVVSHASVTRRINISMKNCSLAFRIGFKCQKSLPIVLDLAWVILRFFLANFCEYRCKM